MSNTTNPITAPHNAARAIRLRPSDEEQKVIVTDYIRMQRKLREERAACAKLAVESLQRLVQVCAVKSAQGYKIREILFSLWNGRRADLSETLVLDWNVKQDLCSVILAFGYEDKEIKFFYAAMAQEFKSAGLLEWFTELGDETQADHKNADWKRP